MFKFNEKEFKVATIRADLNYETLATKLSMSRAKFYNVIENNGNFKLGDIHKIVEILHLSTSDVISIFFGG